ncbi:virulence factor [Burkholderia sp. BCCIQ04A]|uniref:Virulence factor n=2 Tax=Burkholderiaceae TaxID=119060 RepID=A0ABU5WHM5_9BURK|nr:MULTISPECIES: virulence factor [Burkholderia]MEB2502535.1 virulence factor [Burkholderia anthinoferrum]MEB2533739.1 virulence factor [Burkholderia anthinoferrum]MEB2559807.1 virulence factor [Burkholderia anthinoferrum]MEB2578408.1 virulence factor [Burkholderia anthinoferrum]MDF3097858.1 virulence factor [Burkholderia semiarida]
MRTIIATWPRRIGLACAVMVITSLVSLVLAISTGDSTGWLLNLGELMKRLVLLPGLLAIVVLALASVLVAPKATAAPAAGTAFAGAEAAPSKPFVAQVVGLEWMNPLQRRDYPTEWQLLWTLGLAKPNKNDDMVRTNPKKYSTLQAISIVADGQWGSESFVGFYKKYVRKLLVLFRTRYVTSSSYFYTIKSDNKSEWRELAGIHVELAIPKGRLDPVLAGSFLRDEMVNAYEIGNPSAKNLWSHDTPPDVHVTSGQGNAGFTSLNAALDYLAAHPDKSAWVMNWDAPSFPPNDEQINENMVVLFLAGPDLKTEREPLAWIGKAARSNVKDFEVKQGASRAVQAWKSTIDTAASNAGVPVSSLNYIVHDAGKGSDAASTRIASLSQTLTEVLPEYDFRTQTFNTSALLGDMGAGAALTDVALAIGRANHLGGNVLVAGTTDAEHPTAVVVVAPSKLTPIDPGKDWFRARGENNAYLPWWGRRHDARPAPQGYSE